MISKLNPDLRHLIQKATHADSSLCWNCSSCDAECPVEIATNRLRPQRIVRLANLGLFEELITSAEIWYCLTCRRCNAVCPNVVKPETLVGYARAAAVRCGVVAHATARAYYDLFRRFQRVRWHAVSSCLNDGRQPISDAQWHSWLDTPIPDSRTVIASRRIFPTHRAIREAVQGADLSNCFTCGECSSACPISGERSAFDPRFIFRMVNLGLAEELLRSPSLWLCVQCGRCTAACPQIVDGCRLIANLREIAVQEGQVKEDFGFLVRDAQKEIFLRWVDEVDRLLGVPDGSRSLPSCSIPVATCA